MTPSDGRRRVQRARRADVVVPEVVVTIAAGRPARAVWENELGGLTFEVGAGDDRVFVKWSPAGDAPDLTVEAGRLQWAARHTVVPRVLDLGTDHGGSWMVTSALSGASAVAPEWIARPEVAVTGLGRGLRALHDALPVDDCPFSWSVDERVVRAADRWADLAVATWSTEWNYGAGWEGLLLDAYGVEPDPDRTDFYRWLWDLAS